MAGVSAYIVGRLTNNGAPALRDNVFSPLFLMQCLSAFPEQQLQHYAEMKTTETKQINLSVTKL